MATKAWVLTYTWPYEATVVLGVFSSLKKAKKAAERNHAEALRRGTGGPVEWLGKNGHYQSTSTTDSYNFYEINRYKIQ